MPYVLSFLAGAAGYQVHPYFPILLSAAFVLACLALARRGRAALAALVLLGALYGHFRHLPGEVPGPLPREARVEGVFAAPAAALEGGFSQEFRPASGLPVKAIDVLSAEEFEAGRRYALDLKVVSPPERLNPASGPRTPYAILVSAEAGGERLAAPWAALARVRQRLNAFMGASFGPREAALLMAVTTGQRSALDGGTREAFNASGLAHLLSISGTHFAFFFLLLFGVFRAAVKYLPHGLLERVTVYLTPSQAAAALSMPFMALYLGISGASVPSIRAFVMITLFLLGLLLGRKGAWLNSLLLAALLLVLWEPAVVASLSFQLSFLAVLFIGFAVRGGEGRPEAEGAGGRRARALRRLLAPPAKTLLITLAASAGTAPLVAYHFHYASLVSPLSNLVVTPLVGFVLVPLSLAGSFLYLATGSYLLEPLAGAAARAALGLVGWFASLPMASVGVRAFPPALLLAFYGGCLLYAASRRRAALALAAAPLAVYLILAAASPAPLSVTFLDAGQADASVLQLPDGKTIVVDTGRSGREVVDHLRLLGVRKVDALALTHSHPDHTGGAGRLAGAFPPGEIWDNGRLLYPGGLFDGVRRRALERGDALEGEGWEIAVMHPHKKFYTAAGRRGTEENNDSLVLRIAGAGGGSFLLAGDIEAEAEEDLASLSERLRSGLLKVPHHGLGTSVHGGFLRAVSPSAAVVTSAEADEGLARALPGARIYLTGVDGAVKAEECRRGICVKTWREAKMKRIAGLDPGEELRNLGRLFTVW
ncbi:MAG: DNA internalization-related competence protein ComEC/Rec2 [Thermodesulfovibrionales bacterium]